MTATQAARPKLYIVGETESEKTESVTASPELGILAALQKLEDQNEYLIKLAETQASKLAQEQRTATVTETTTAVPLISGDQAMFFGGGQPLPADFLRSIDVYTYPYLRLGDEKWDDMKWDDVKQPTAVPLHLILQIGALFMGVFCIGSLLIWIAGGFALLNPFAAVLLLAASPFFFAMGSAAKSRVGKRS